MKVACHLLLTWLFCAQGKKLQYSTFGAACTEVEINVLSGERRVLRADVLHDAGQSISPAVDMGQVTLLPCQTADLHFNSSSIQRFT